MGDAVQEFTAEHLPWIERVVDTLIETWEAVPLAQRWTLGMFVVVSLVASKWILPALARLVAAIRGQVTKGPPEG